MKWLVALLSCIGIAQAQVIQHQISDDGYARVPLQFPFPYYGRIFTESYMFSNGVVGFLNPSNSWCCTGFDLRTNNGTPFSFSIMPLQTDLLNYSGKFLTEGTPQYQRYRWENISEFGIPENLNTFGLEIRPSGYIGMNYEQVNISPTRPVTIGMTGDIGEFSQIYHGAGYSSNNIILNSVSSTGNLCLISPLSDPSCPNYSQAYLDSQCLLNALYSPSCQGYEQAYALTNIITPRTSVAIPQLQVSSTGTISVETPIVADSVVNEVITRPSQVSSQSSVASTQQLQSIPVEKTKESVKSETKQDAKSEAKQAPKQQVKIGSIEVPTIATPVIKIEQVQIVDLLSRKMISKPINRSERDFYLMMVGTHKLHEVMIDGQYGKGN